MHDAEAGLSRSRFVPLTGDRERSARLRFRNVLS
jgi:hypothetical protein